MIHQPAPVVLLIDEDPAFVYLIKRYGQMCACPVVSFPTLAAARQVIEVAPPALVMVHVAPPAFEGVRTVRALKAGSATQQIPLLACGAITDAPIAREAGADYWLSKPVMYDDFHAVLVALLICL